jgi:Predicted periplasmic protein (DUF2092)
MNSSDEKSVRPTIEQLRVDLRRLDWAIGLREETLTAITNAAEWVEFHTGQVILEVESEITYLYFRSQAGCSQRFAIRWLPSCNWSRKRWRFRRPQVTAWRPHTLSFTAVELFEHLTRQGAPLGYTTKYEVTLQRPDKLRVLKPADGPQTALTTTASR